MDSGTASRVTPLRDGVLDRVAPPPSNTEAEQALLGAMLVNNAAYGRVSEFLEAAHFANAAHGRIYAAVGKLIDRGQIANPVTLKNLFDQDGALTEIGGAQYLARLAASAVTIINTEDYGRTIYDLHLRRELITLGQDVVSDAFRHDLDDAAVTQIERAERKLFDLASASVGKSGGPRPISDFSAESIARSEAAYQGEGKLAGVSTGVADLDRKLGGYPDGSLTYIGGASGQGKTTLACTLLLSAARAGLRVLFFSAELLGKDISMMLQAGLTAISAERQLRGDLTAIDWNELVRAQGQLGRSGIVIDDTPSIDISVLRQRSIQMKRRQGLNLIVVDFVQLISASGSNRGDGMEASIRKVSHGLKELAKELNVPVVATSQITREVDKRDDKRPHISDLQWASALEQDAGIIAMVFRPEYYLARAEPVRGPNESDLKFAERHVNWVTALDAAKGRAEIIIPKNRFGRTGVARCFFNPERSMFVDDSREIDIAGGLL